MKKLQWFYDGNSTYVGYPPRGENYAIVAKEGSRWVLYAVNAYGSFNEISTHKTLKLGKAAARRLF